MDRVSGVQPISLATVFRRRSRHSRYTMTTITTARRNAPIISVLWGPGTFLVNLWRPGMAFRAFPLNLTAVPPVKLTTVGSRAFPVAAAAALIWKSAPTLQSFSRHLKTFLPLQSFRL